jgi:hypothetical protein
MRTYLPPNSALFASFKAERLRGIVDDSTTALGLDPRRVAARHLSLKAGRRYRNVDDSTTALPLERRIATALTLERQGRAALTAAGPTLSDEEE